MSLVRFRPEAPIQSSDSAGLLYAGVAHLVERHLAKVEVAGSSPVARSIYYRSKRLAPLFHKQPPLAGPLAEYRAAGAHMLMGEEDRALPPDMAT